MRIARAYKVALFAGSMDEVGSYFTDLERIWYDAGDRVIVEIRERSWLQSSPRDVMDQRPA